MGAKGLVSHGSGGGRGRDGARPVGEGVKKKIRVPCNEKTNRNN